MFQSLSSRIVTFSLIGWIGCLLFCAPLFIHFAREAAAHNEQDLYTRVAVELAAELAKVDEPGRRVELLSELTRVNPDLTPYVLDESGRVILAVDPRELGAEVAPASIAGALGPEDLSELRCGSDPARLVSCPAYSAARLGSSAFVYVVANRGAARLLSGTQGALWILGYMRTALIISCLAIGLIIWNFTRFVARDVLELARILRRYSAGDYTERFAIRSRDELSLLGAAVNTMADAVQARKEELAAVLGQRQRFLAELVHDLRRPAAVVRLALERGKAHLAGTYSAPGDDVPATIREALGAERILLDNLGRLEEKDVSATAPADETILLPKILDDVASCLRPIAEAKGIEFRVESDPSVLPCYGSTSDLYRAILNIGDNGVRYTPAGGRVVLRAYNWNDLSCIEAEDTGIGVSEGDAPRLGEYFFRSEDAKTMNPSGSGLGLAGVRRTVHALGGSFSLSRRTTTGSGTLARLLLPTALNQIVPRSDALQSPTGRKVPTSSLTHVLREYFVFEEGAVVSAVLVTAVAPPTVSVGSLVTWLGLLAAVLYMLARVRYSITQIRAEPAPLDSIDAERWIPPEKTKAMRILFLALLSFGAVWSSGATLFLTHEHSNAKLLYAITSGFLIGAGFLNSSLVYEMVPLMLSLVLPVILLLLQQTGVVHLVLLALGAAGGSTVAHQLKFPRFRSITVRAGLILLTCNMTSVLVFQYFFLEHHAKLFRGGAPLVTPSLTSDIANLLAPLDFRRDARTDASPLQKKLTVLSFENPRLDMMVECGAGTRCAFSTAFSLSPFAAPVVTPTWTPSLGESGASLASEGNQQLASILIPGTPPGRRLFLSGESKVSDLTLRKVLQRYLLFAVGGGHGFALFFTIFISLIAFGDVRRRLTTLSRLVRGLGETDPDAAASPRPRKAGDEIDQITAAVGQLSTSIRLSSAALHSADRQTRETVQAARIALRSLHDGVAERLSAHAAHPQVEALLDDLLKLNRQRENILTDIFAIASHVKSGTEVSGHVVLRDILEDALLEIHARHRGEPVPPFEVRMGDELSVRANEHLLLSAVTALIEEVLETSDTISPVRCSGVSATHQSEAAALTLEFTLRRPADAGAPASAHKPLRCLLAELLLDGIGAEIELAGSGPTRTLTILFKRHGRHRGFGENMSSIPEHIGKIGTAESEPTSSV